MALVSLYATLPDSIFDLRYTTTNNITGTVLAEASTVAQLDETAAKHLTQAAHSLKQQGFTVVIWDAFRPAAVQQRLREIDQEGKYVLEKSQHSLGLAIDCTLATSDGSYLDMGTDHDEFGPLAHAKAMEITKLQRTNRNLLRDVMSKYGFVVWPYEWWHFDYVADLSV